MSDSTGSGDADGHPEQRTHANGVPIDRYGTWCRHGHHVHVVDPSDHSAYPGTIDADPWPCDVCTPQSLADETEQEAAQYEADRWAEARALGVVS